MQLRLRKESSPPEMISGYFLQRSGVGDVSQYRLQLVSKLVAWLPAGLSQPLVAEVRGLRVLPSPFLLLLVALLYPLLSLL